MAAPNTKVIDNSTPFAFFVPFSVMSQYNSMAITDKQAGDASITIYDGRRVGLPDVIG